MAARDPLFRRRIFNLGAGAYYHVRRSTFAYSFGGKTIRPSDQALPFHEIVNINVKHSGLELG